MNSKEWKQDSYEMKKLFKELIAYVECNDFFNAHHVAQILSFKVKMCPQYEEERIKKVKK